MFRAARGKLAIWNVFVLAVILLLLETAIYTVFTEQVYSGVDQDLRAYADKVVAAVDAAGSIAPALTDAQGDPAYRTFVAGTNGQQLSNECVTLFPPCPPGALDPTSKAGLREVEEHGHEDARTDWFMGHPWRALTFAVPLPGVVYFIQIARPASGEAEAVQHLRLLLILGAILTILLSAVGSLFLTNMALGPIRQAFSRQRQFTADASHELRTPLALIRANAEMLARHGDRLPPGDDELIGEIIRETDHLNRLVADLLTLARADAETVQIETKPVDLRALVSEVHEDLQHIAESRGIESDISLNGPVTISGDQVRLRQLLLILLDNALKYTDPGGRVDVSLNRQDNRARLVISDTGIGIPPEDQAHIFERFYRVDRAREHESGGTGLGLSIAQWIVQAHNGSIKVESEVGKGTKFQVDLPTTSAKENGS